MCSGSGSGPSCLMMGVVVSQEKGNTEKKSVVHRITFSKNVLYLFHLKGRRCGVISGIYMRNN